MSAIVLSECSVKVDLGKHNSFVLCCPHYPDNISLDEKNWRIILDQLERNYFTEYEPPFNIMPIPLVRDCFSSLVGFLVHNHDEDGNNLVYLRINRAYYGPRGDLLELVNEVRFTEADVCILKEFINECTKPETD